MGLCQRASHDLVLPYNNGSGDAGVRDIEVRAEREILEADLMPGAGIKVVV